MIIYRNILTHIYQKTDLGSRLVSSLDSAWIYL